MQKKKWDDIPSLAGLEMDWEFQPASPHGKRVHARMDEKELARLFDGQRVLVKVATAETTFTGSLHDICEGGLAVKLDCRLAENQAIDPLIDKLVDKGILTVKEANDRSRFKVTSIRSACAKKAGIASEG